MEEEKSNRRQEREKNQEGSSKCHEGTLVSEWWTVVRIVGASCACDKDLDLEREKEK